MSSGEPATKRARDLQDNIGGVADDRDGGVPGADRAEPGAMAEMKGMMERMQRRVCELEKQCRDQEGKRRSLEARCESLERSVRILAKESRWEYPAPPIPANHWEGRGFDDDYIEATGHFIAAMKDSTIHLRGAGEGTGMISFCFWGGEADDDRALIHDDLFMSHWEEFADALQLCNTSTNPLRIFALSNIQLTSSVLDILTPALMATNIRELHLQRNEFANASDGVNFAIKIIQSCPDMEKLDWIRNPITSLNDADDILKAVVNHPSLEKITFNGCFGEGVNGHGALRSLLASNKAWSEIIFVSNNVRPSGQTHLPDYLATNPPLKKLHLRDNYLTDTDAVLIAEALKHNTNLETLYLDGNEMTKVGREALKTAIYDPTSFNTMADCNHRCYIWGILIPKTRNVFDNSEILARNNRARKLYILLSLKFKEGTLVQHLDSEFGEDDLNLAPKLLESIFNNGTDDEGRQRLPIRPLSMTRKPPHPVSMVYEILRRWRMPELFERHV